MNMLKYIPIAIAVVLLVASALVQGHLSQRWGTFPELEAMANQLQNVPLEIGDWKGAEGEKMDAKMRKAAGAVGDLHRVYTTGGEKEAVSLDIVCGRPRDMLSHTPDRCYPAAGFERGGTQTRT